MGGRRKEDEQAIRWAPDFRGRNWPGMHSFVGGHLKGRVEGGGDELGRWIFVWRCGRVTCRDFTPLSNRRCGLGLWELSTFKWSKEITVH